MHFYLSARFGKSSDLGHEHAFNATSTLVIILLGLIFAIALAKLGLDDMALALVADRRERASLSSRYFGLVTPLNSHDVIQTPHLSATRMLQRSSRTRA